MKELETEKLLEKSDSLEAQILTVVTALEDQVAKGILPIKTITDAFNEDKAEKVKITYQRVGRRLSAMGFKKAKTSDGASAIIWDEECIARMKESYGLEKTSETPETPDLPTDDTDVSGETDVFRSVHEEGFTQ